MNRSTFQPGPLADVESHHGDEGWTLVFVRDLRNPPEQVWTVLTDPEQLREWAPFVPDRNLDTLGETTLTMIDGDTREELASTVTRAERPAVLEYRWGSDVVRWELARTESGTRLTLRHTVQGPDWLPKAAAGWHICLDVAEQLLDGSPVGAIVGQEALNFGWSELNDAYAERLGVDAGGESEERGS